MPTTRAPPHRRSKPSNNATRNDLLRCPPPPSPTPAHSACVRLCARGKQKKTTSKLCHAACCAAHLIISVRGKTSQSSAAATMKKGFEAYPRVQRPTRLAHIIRSVLFHKTTLRQRLLVYLFSTGSVMRNEVHTTMHANRANRNRSGRVPNISQTKKTVLNEHWVPDFWASAV